MEDGSVYGVFSGHLHSSTLVGISGLKPRFPSIYCQSHRFGVFTRAVGWVYEIATVIDTSDTW